MKKTLFLLAFAIIVSPVNAFAECFTPAQAEADQGIRIHSELMVIGLNCQHMGKRAGQNLYGDYRKFTADHANLFAKYETILMDYFKTHGDKNPEASLNALRTAYANKISKEAAGMRPDIFCASYASRIPQATAMKEEELRKWASTIFPSHPVSRPVCKT